MPSGIGAAIGGRCDVIWRPGRTLATASAWRWRDDLLWVGDERVGELRWLEETGLVAVAEIADEHWIFRRDGFWRPRIVAQCPTGEDMPGLFEPGVAGHGTLFVASRRSYTWRAATYWDARWQWVHLDHLPLMDFVTQPVVSAIEGRVEIAPQAIALPELGLLTALGWYLLTLHAADEAAHRRHEEALGGDHP